MKLQRVPYSGSTDSRIVHGTSGSGPKGEDVARISGKHDKTACIAYPDKLAKEIVRAVNGRAALVAQLDEANDELDRRKATRGKLKPINLDAISRSSDKVFTHISLETYDLREQLKDPEKNQLRNWLEFGECRINNEGNKCSIGARMRSGITDWEHDTPYVVYIDLLGLKFVFAESHIMHFEAHLTPDPNEIKIYPADFVPEDQESAAPCEHEHCKPHLTIKDFVPPVYELAHLVAGKRISITMGPRWDALEPEDEDA